MSVEIAESVAIALVLGAVVVIAVILGRPFRLSMRDDQIEIEVSEESTEID